MTDLSGSHFAGLSGLRLSTNPFASQHSIMPAGEDLPGQARVAADAAPKEVNGPKRPLAGLLPMRPGRQYTIIVKRPQMDRAEAQRKLAQLQRALRLSQQKESEAEAAYLAAAPVGGTLPAATSDAAAAYTKAINERGAIANLYAKVSRLAARDPHEVVCTIAQDPALMGEAFADPAHPPVWICLHDRCRGQEWSDARALMADHPAADLQRKGEAHVYGLWSKTQIDPDAPVAGVLGLIAPVSSDGTAVTKIAAAYAEVAEEGGVGAREPVEPVDMAAILAEAEGAKGKRHGKREGGAA